METTDHKAQAKKLVAQLEKERAGDIMLGAELKSLPAAKTILAAAPELQAAFVQEVVQTYAKLGTSKDKFPNVMYPEEWFREDNVPSGSAEVVRLLLRKQLPFTDDALAEMFEQLADINYLSLVEFLEQIVGHVEKRAAKQPLSPKLHKAIGHFADMLVGRQLSEKDARAWKEEFGFPTAADRKMAARIAELRKTALRRA